MGTCGTEENSFIWCNTTDNTGIVFAGVVWIFFLFAIYFLVAVVFLVSEDITNGSIISVLLFMALWSHTMTMMNDPGSVPSNAHPVLSDKSTQIAMCGRCDGYKPYKSHHDRVSNRCISRMDHFCPWTNNSIGAKNQKQFFLFLIYTDLASFYTYFYLSIRLAFCDRFSCSDYVGNDLVLARVLLFVILFGILFTSSMIVNQIYGLVSGVGTIDRMKLKGEFLPDEESVPFSHVFGDHWPTYWLPIEPTFYEPEKVFHYRLCEESYSKTSEV